MVLLAPDLKMANVAFASNTAVLGGAISLISHTNIDREYENCTFVNNSAETGGALHLYSGVGADVLDDSVFSDNFARK